MTTTPAPSRKSTRPPVSLNKSSRVRQSKHPAAPPSTEEQLRSELGRAVEANDRLRAKLRQQEAALSAAKKMANKAGDLAMLRVLWGGCPSCGAIASRHARGCGRRVVHGRI